MTELPQVEITSSDGGWLVTCSCGFERHCARRPAADRVASDHRARPHARRRDQPSNHPKPRTTSTWDDREESTWIDRL